MTNKGLALGGAALLVVGLFTPIVTLPFVGSVNLFNNGTNVTALVLVAFATIGAALVLRQRAGDAIWPGAAAALLLAYQFVRLQLSLSQMRESMAKSLEGNPFAGLAQNALGSVQLQWGWIVLALGAGLLVYAGVAARKEAGVALARLDGRPAKVTAVLSAALLLAAAAWDWRNRSAEKPPADPMASTTSTTMAGSTSAAVADGPSAEEAAYIARNLRLYDLEAKYYDSMLDGRVPGVDFKIRNTGDRTLNRVAVRIMFLDASGRPIAEEEYTPVLISEYNVGGDNTPLRPNYIWQNEPDRFYTAKSVPSEWREGKATATITDVEFAPEK